MCVSVPCKVVALGQSPMTVMIDVGGHKREVSCVMMGERVPMGSWVLVRGGFVTRVVPSADAEQTFATLVMLTQAPEASAPLCH